MSFGNSLWLEGENFDVSPNSFVRLCGELSHKENVDISPRRVLHMRTLDLELRTSVRLPVCGIRSSEGEEGRK